MNTDFCPVCDTPDAIFQDPTLYAAICYSCYSTFCTQCENKLTECSCDPQPPRRKARRRRKPHVDEATALKAFTDV